MSTRRSFLTLVLGVGAAVAYESSAVPPRVDDESLDLLARRTRALRVEATEFADPLVPSLERHWRFLSDLLGDAPREFRGRLARLAAESAWLTANAYSDSGDDAESLRWAAAAARLAEGVADHDLRAHAVSRVSRTYLSLGDADRALKAIDRVDSGQLSPFGRVRVEVHRALIHARLLSDSERRRTRRALEALDAARTALASSAGSSRPDWVWWSDDSGFVRSWEAEVLRSLALPELAVPAFRSALVTAAEEDVREMPFLQAGLAEVVAQSDDLSAAADEAIRAVILAKAVGAEAALGRVHSVYRIIQERAPASRHARSVREALRS